MDFNSQTCERRYLNDTFRPFGIPYDAKYVDTLEIGSNIGPDLGIEVYVWEGIDTESKEGPIRYSVLYTIMIIDLFRQWHLYQYVHNQRLPSSG